MSCTAASHPSADRHRPSMRSPSGLEGNPGSMPRRCSTCIQTPGGHITTAAQFTKVGSACEFCFESSPLWVGEFRFRQFVLSLILDCSILLYLILEIPLCSVAAYETRGHALFEQSDSGLDCSTDQTDQSAVFCIWFKYVPKGIATNQQLMLPPAGRLRVHLAGRWAQLSTTVPRRTVRVKWRQANRLTLFSQGGKTTSKAMPGCLGCGLGPLRMSGGGAQMGEPQEGFL